MNWLPFLVLITISSAQTTPDSQANVLNNLAALESAEKILKTIDDLTSSVTPISVTTEAVTQVASTKLVSVDTTNAQISDGRRAGSVAPQMEAIYNSDNGLRALWEIKRHMQSILKDPAVYQHIFTYGVPRQPLYLNNAFPPQIEVAKPPNYGYMPPIQQRVPLQYATQLQSYFPEYTNLENSVLKQNVANVVQYGQTPRKFSEMTLPTIPLQRIRPVQNIPFQSTAIPAWMLLALQEMQGRRPLGSPTIGPPLFQQALYPQDASLVSVDSPNIVEAAFQETNEKVKSMEEWQPPQPPFPTLYIPPSTELPPVVIRTRAPTLTVSLPPLTMVAQTAKKTRPVLRQLPKAVSGRLRVNPLLSANARLPLKAMAPVDARSLTKPRATSTARTISNFQSRIVPRLPATRNRFNLIAKKKPPSESLLKLTRFMRENRDTLLQFIAMKRNLLLGQNKGAMVHRNALLSQIQNVITARKGHPDRAPRLAAFIKNGANGNIIEERKQRAKVKRLRSKGNATNLPVDQPVVRALPDEFPGHMLDLAPGRGAKIKKMRYKDRVCQRNVMLISGPKYDREARVIQREFRPGVDRRVFRVTKRKKMLLPACCNCCKKSVLGCE